MKRLDTKLIFLFLVGMILIITSCTSNSSALLPTPEIGKSSLTGYLVTGQGIPLKNTTIRLAEVYRQSENSENGAYLLDTAFSPGTVTDENGFFFFQNIEPREYVIVIGDVENNNYEIISQQNGLPRIWILTANQVIDVGTIKVNF